MFNIPNFLSLLRAPLALCFLQANPLIRAGALIAAMISDCLDGYIARRFKMVSKVGTFLDPLMDKFFVLFIACTFIYEGKLGIPETLALISRDFAVVLFGIYLASTGKLSQYRFRSIWCGKATTALQFVVLLLLNFGIIIPIWLYSAFIALGGLALFELYLPTATQVYRQIDS